MGLFGNLFGGNGTKGEKQLPWISLTSREQLREIKERSKTRSQFIFKHSTTCGISRMVLGMFSRDYAFEKDAVDLYFLDLHTFREVSNEVAKEFQVLHQSPQLIVIKNGVAVFHASHGAIAETHLERFL